MKKTTKVKILKKTSNSTTKSKKDILKAKVSKLKKPKIMAKANKTIKNSEKKETKNLKTIPNINPKSNLNANLTVNLTANTKLNSHKNQLNSIPTIQNTPPKSVNNNLSNTLSFQYLKSLKKVKDHVLPNQMIPRTVAVVHDLNNNVYYMIDWKDRKFTALKSEETPKDTQWDYDKKHWNKIA